MQMSALGRIVMEGLSEEVTYELKPEWWEVNPVMIEGGAVQA